MPDATLTVRRPATRAATSIKADICVLGAGISGVSAALEAAKLGRSVVLVDGAPALGGQAIGSIIGTIIGLYTHGPQPYQITHGIADRWRVWSPALSPTPPESTPLSAPL